MIIVIVIIIILRKEEPPQNHIDYSSSENQMSTILSHKWMTQWTELSHITNEKALNKNEAVTGSC